MTAKPSGKSGSLEAMANKTPAQLDAEIAEVLRRKRKAFDINPSSSEVVRAFLESGYRADDVGIQEFVAKKYGGWVRQYERGRSALSLAAETSYDGGIWQWIIDELTTALRAHGVRIEEDR